MALLNVLIKLGVMKKNKKPEGIIYSAQNLVSNQHYIGATSKTLKKRKKDHIYKASNGSCNVFHLALKTYGLENFEWKEVDKADTIEELARKERKYILLYDSFKNGYNSESHSGIKKHVFRYNPVNGELINKYASLESASNAVNAPKKKLSKACLKENYRVGDSFWSYNHYKEPFVAKRDRRKKAVIQLDIENNILNVFNSLAQAALTTGVFKSSIAKVCRQERNIAGGYKWKYK